MAFLKVIINRLLCVMIIRRVVSKRQNNVVCLFMVKFLKSTYPKFSIITFKETFYTIGNLNQVRIDVEPFNCPTQRRNLDRKR